MDGGGRGGVNMLVCLPFPRGDNGNIFRTGHVPPPPPVGEGGGSGVLGGKGVGGLHKITCSIYRYVIHVRYKVENMRFYAILHFLQNLPYF